MDAHLLHIALNALDFWALFACVGFLVTRLWLLPASVWADPVVARRWHRLFGFGLAAVTVTGMALFVIRVMEMGSSSFMDSLPLLPQVLQQTHFGHAWGLHLVALAALWFGWGLSRRLSSEGGMGFMLAAMLLLAFTYSASSHAADQGDFKPSEFIDWLHVLAASTWGGGILGTLLFIFPALRQQSDQQHGQIMADAAARLSTLSAFALMAVFLTGLLNAVFRLGNFDTLITTGYGRILSAKLLLVALMALIGAINRLLLVPKVQQQATTGAKGNHAVGQLRLSLRIDSALVLLVLVAAAFLIQGMPPAAMQGMPGMEKGNMPGMESMPGMQQGAMEPMESTVPAHLQITHARVHAMTAGQDAAEAFMDITSRMKTTLVRIDSPDADAVEMDHMAKENGVKRMQPMDTVVLPAGIAVRFAPGADRLMLVHPHRHLAKGDEVTLRLYTLNANGSQGTRSLTVPVLP